MTNDVSFQSAQQGGAPLLLATATAARVEVWSLQQKEKKDAKDKDEDDDFGDDMLEPKASIRRFTEEVTAIKLREDGALLLAGDKLGKIELIELK